VILYTSGLWRFKTEGLYFTKFGDKDNSIEVAVASVSVKIKK